jgi:hypothetical protein
MVPRSHASKQRSWRLEFPGTARFQRALARVSNTINRSKPLTKEDARWKRAIPDLEFWRARRYDLGSLVFFLLFFVIFFRPALFTGKFYCTSDAFVYLYPLRTLVFSELRHGRLPLWTSQIMSGYPLLSMAQIGTGYPLTWTYLFLPGRWAEEIYALAPYLLAPAFTYAYLREIGREHLGAVFGALTFTYGGFMISPLTTYSGLAANAVMWLPLMLIAVERARTRRFIPCLLGATGAYAMCVLSGWAQGVVLSGTIAITYAAFIAVAPESGFPARQAPWDPWPNVENDGPMRTAPGLLSWLRWRPLLVMLCATFLSAGIASFQILETMRAQRRSIRSQLTYDLFTMGSYKPGELVKSFLLPLHYIFETSAYVAPLALALALVGILVAVRTRDRDWRVFFWLGCSLVGLVMMLGKNTPLFKLPYYIPPFNLFRGAARHAIEVTLGVSILSAFGWDALSALASRLNSKVMNEERKRRALYFGLALLSMALLAGILWMADAARTRVGEMEIYYYPSRYPASRYWFWKLGFSLLTLTAAWQALRVRAAPWRHGLLLATIAVACFFEPSIMVARWRWPTLKPASRFTAVSPTTRFLVGYPPEQNRVYTRVYPFVEEHVDPPQLEPANLSMIHGLQNVAGSEPLILDRYSRALGNVYIDAVKTRPGYVSDPSLLESDSHVLDLLNDRFLVSYSDLATETALPIEKEGVKFCARDLDTTINPGNAITLKGVSAEADTIALVTATAWSHEAVDGTPVARVRLISPQGKIVERWLRTGIDTAEWAHDRTNVKPLVRHSMAAVFSSTSADPNDHEPSYRFITRQPLGERMRVDHIEITNVSNKVVLLLSKATLVDSVTRFSMPLPHYDLSKWRPVYDHNGVLVLRNENALPRAWLVKEAEAVDADEALNRIRGQGKPFDPRRTALLELPPHSLPALPGGQISPAASARIAAYENNRLAVDTDTDTASVLIVSEINYPGWVATVDGVRAPIISTDFLLRGVALPAGSHRVEMRYTAPAARTGAFISVFSLLVIGGLFVYNRRSEFKL